MPLTNVAQLDTKEPRGIYNVSDPKTYTKGEQQLLRTFIANGYHPLIVCFNHPPDEMKKHDKEFAHPSVTYLDVVTHAMSISQISLETTKLWQKMTGKKNGTP
ncbi:hypothetical protein HY490_01970 [Candidatus Woesearchaeota archaeon]|nr:hypothetical protein [Candidatus Woesearchaeota archaeon]